MSTNYENAATQALEEMRKQIAQRKREQSPEFVIEAVEEHVELIMKTAQSSDWPEDWGDKKEAVSDAIVLKDLCNRARAAIKRGNADDTGRAFFQLGGWCLMADFRKFVQYIDTGEKVRKAALNGGRKKKPLPSVDQLRSEVGELEEKLGITEARKQVGERYSVSEKTIRDRLK